MLSSLLPDVARQRGMRALKLDDWRGQIAVVIGNGTSLVGRDLSVLHLPGVRTMVANIGYLLFPKADVLMCSDRHWLAANSHDLTGYEGERIVVTRPEAVSVIDPRMRYIQRAFIEKIEGDIFKREDVLVEGHTSTSTNISLAVLQGATKIALIGIDLRPGPDGQRRAGEDVRDDAARAKARYEKQVYHLTMQADHVRRRGVEVFNCSPRSALACYPYAELEDVLC